MSSSEAEDSAGREARLDGIIADYLAAEDRGQPPAAEDLIAGHPEFAQELSAFFIAQARLRRLARRSRGADRAPEPAETISGSDLGTTAVRGDDEPDPMTTEVDDPPEAEDPSAAEPDPAFPDGSRVRYFGDFILIEVLGRGGMGIVYRARQVSLDRQVALKMIRADRLAGTADLRRFRNEVEVVSRLDHPNLLPVLEFGQHAGQRYFTMPLVAGGSLADHLEGYVDDLRDAAETLAAVADAVQHAHERGILHRDLKPGNVLLDAEGRPHVSDFGLARRLDVEPGLTQDGAILGTPAYMSPEQASGLREAVTTAADVYGLGAILYAMITGRPPHQGDSTADLLRRVRDVAPEPPSRLNPRIDGRLENVCLKCLEKEPRRRYASAAALAADLRRWLRGEPVEARPAGPAVRLFLWCRRRPAQATLAGLLAASLLLGSVAVFWQWRQAEGERWTNRSIDAFFRQTFLGYKQPLDYAYRRQMTVEELFDQAATKLETSFEGPPAVEAGIREAVGSTYRALGRFDKAEPHLRRCLRLRQEFLGADDSTRLGTEAELASLLTALGRLDEAGPLATHSAERLTAVLGPSHPSTLDALAAEAEWLHARGRLEEAEASYRRQLSQNELVRGAEDDGTLGVVSGLALVIQQRGGAALAEPLHRRVVESLRRRLRPDHPRLLAALNALGGNLILQSKLGDAESVLTEALEASRRNAGIGHPDTLRIQTNLAALQFRQNRFDDAERTIRAALAAQARVLPDDHPEVLANLNTLASVLVRRMDWAGAEAIFRKILLARESTVGGDHSDTAAAKVQLGESLIELGKASEAVPLLATALDVYRTRLSAAGQGDGPAAEEDARRAASEIGRVLTFYGSALLGAGEPARAEPVLGEAVQARRSALPEQDWRLANSESLHGESFLALKRYSEAEPILVHSYGILSRAPDAVRLRVEQARRRLVRLYDEWGKPDQAAKYRPAAPP
ncbi:serine/threonine-protein kinase [Aquisphaera insulae]|uniref:serine/threonine-protein kinase n=1 Tax=Aquisphaera insulae TaxID=2712864 RepID=UPI0013EB8094|nr:serine/threonine-protein kinase [Aquisphaera insulae]